MGLTKEERIEKIKNLQELFLKANFKQLAPHTFELRGPFSRTLTLCTLVHGNEIGGVEVFFNLLSEIQSRKLTLKSNLRMMLGNVEAYYEDKRFLETDLNRSFGLKEPRTDEEFRAQELGKYLADSDVLIDIHQTIGPTSTPFYIFEFDQKSYDLARYLRQNLPVVTYTMARPFKGETSTAYIIGKGGMGITVETGQKGIEDTQISLGLEIARKAIETDFEKSLPTFSLSNTYTFSQIINNLDGSLELVKEFNNFDSVKKDEILARNSEKEVRSEVDGLILFPKYGTYAKVSKELALILKPVNDIKDL